MPRLAPGDLAPDFSLPDQRGNPVRLADFRGHPVLVYFYPKADTPGCTIQACSVRDADPSLAEAGLAVLGISPDAPDDQAKFAAKFALGFPLLADADHQVAEAYGAWGEKSFMGRTSLGIVRSAFLVDGGGILLAAWYRIRPEDMVPKALAMLAGNDTGT